MITKREFISGAASVAAVASGASWAAAGVPGGGGAGDAGDAAGAGAGAGDAGAAAVAGAPPAARLLPQLVLFNERYTDARAFAQVLAAAGITTLPIAGDLGTLWYGGLRRRVAAGETRIAGLGTPTDLFILRELGREARLRVRYEGLHDCRGCGTLTHTVRTSGQGALEGAARGVAAGIEAGAGEWAAALARALGGGSAAAAAAAPSSLRAMAAAARAGAGPSTPRTEAGGIAAAPAADEAENIIIRTGVAARGDHPGMLVSWILA